MSELEICHTQGTYFEFEYDDYLLNYNLQVYFFESFRKVTPVFNSTHQGSTYTLTPHFYKDKPMWLPLYGDYGTIDFKIENNKLVLYDTMDSVNHKIEFDFVTFDSTRGTFTIYGGAVLQKESEQIRNDRESTTFALKGDGTFSSVLDVPMLPPSQTESSSTTYARISRLLF